MVPINSLRCSLCTSSLVAFHKRSVIRHLRLKKWIVSFIHGDGFLEGILQSLSGATLSSTEEQWLLNDWTTVSTFPSFETILLSNPIVKLTAAASFMKRLGLIWLEGWDSNVKQISNKIHLWSMMHKSLAKTNSVSTPCVKTRSACVEERWLLLLFCWENPQVIYFHTQNKYILTARAYCIGVLQGSFKSGNSLMVRLWDNVFTFWKDGLLWSRSRFPSGFVT